MAAEYDASSATEKKAISNSSWPEHKVPASRKPATPTAQQLFLDQIANGQSVRMAAEAAGVDIHTPYQWRRTNKTFAQSWRIAEEAGTDLIEEEAFRRAVVGVEKPVYRAGEVVGHVADYSDSMLMFLLKARKPDRYGARAGEAASMDASELAKRLNLQGARDALNQKFTAVFKSRRTAQVPRKPD